MNLFEFKNLAVGSSVRHKLAAHALTVVQSFGQRVALAKVSLIMNPSEWQLDGLQVEDISTLRVGDVLTHVAASSTCVITSCHGQCVLAVSTYLLDVSEIADWVAFPIPRPVLYVEALEGGEISVSAYSPDDGEELHEKNSILVSSNARLGSDKLLPSNILRSLLDNVCVQAGIKVSYL